VNKKIIQVVKRENTGKVSTNALRKSGMIPSVIYGLNEPPVAIAISPKVVARIIASDSGMNSTIYLQLDGTDIKRHVIIKELQRHPVTGRLSHVDFIRIDPTHRVRVKVQIRLKGTPVGVKAGGMLDFTHREIEIECLPNLIPPYIDVNVDHLNIGDSLRLDQIVMDSYLTVHGDTHNVVCSVWGKQVGELVSELAVSDAASTASSPASVVNKGKK
jgi:large subunit ribosomal protein L25